MEFFLAILALVLFFLFICLWAQLGRFFILLITNDFSWKDFKNEWKDETDGFEELVYFCWIVIVPILLCSKLLKK